MSRISIVLVALYLTHWIRNKRARIMISECYFHATNNNSMVEFGSFSH